MKWSIFLAPVAASRAQCWPRPAPHRQPFEMLLRLAQTVEYTCIQRHAPELLRTWEGEIGRIISEAEPLPSGVRVRARRTVQQRTWVDAAVGDAQQGCNVLQRNGGKQRHADSLQHCRCCAYQHHRRFAEEVIHHMGPLCQRKALREEGGDQWPRDVFPRMQPQLLCKVVIKRGIQVAQQQVSGLAPVRRRARPEETHPPTKQIGFSERRILCEECSCAAEHRD